MEKHNVMSYNQSMNPRVKICCIKSVEEAKMAIAAGASALGLVSSMPSGPGVISDERVAEISARVPPGIATFLLTSKQSVAEIVEQQRNCGTNTIQICDHLLDGTHVELKKALPGIGIVQVVHVVDESSVEEARNLANHVDAILLDSGNQSLSVKELGGTGRTHDWRLSRRIVEEADAPVYLAGGLKAANVVEAVRSVRPFGLDLCSGVREKDKLHPRKLQAFFNALKIVDS
ncbi:MAG: phosphoribosylanthranilate isomerase [Calditrichia bacterium]